MTSIPATAKKPADRKPKAGEPEPDQFSFEHDGTTHTFAPTLGVLTPGFVRRHRDNEADAVYTLIEALADPDALDALDTMSFKDNAAVMVAFRSHIDAVMGVALGN